MSALLTCTPFLLTFRLECMTQPTSAILCSRYLFLLYYCLRVCLDFLCVMFIAYLLFPWLFLTVACLPRFTLCCVYCLPRCSLLFACLPRFTLCCVYCLPCCACRFLTVCVSALLYLLRKNEGGRVGSCVSLGATIESGCCMEELCQSCGRGCDSTVEEKV